MSELRSWLEHDEDHPRALLEELSALNSGQRRRALRALGGTVEGPEFLESLPVSELGPRTLFRLIECLDGSDPDQVSYLRKWSCHPVEWVAGEALKTLAEHPQKNERFLNERLTEEKRQPVLVALLKTLLTVPGPSFEDGLETVLTDRPSAGTVFYAAALVKQRSPGRLEALADDSEYLRKIHERVSVDPPHPEQRE